jgi:hypothetical protein
MFKINILFTLFILSLTFSYTCSTENGNKSLSEQDAAEFISSYVKALKSGDTNAIKKFWSAVSLNRQGFEVMHLWVRGLIHIDEWKDFLASTHYTYEINDVVEGDGYNVIQGQWQKPDNDSGIEEIHPMPFYVAWENSQWLLANPIDVLTKNWNRYETDKMVFLYSKEINIDDHLHEIKRLDETYQSMCRAMEFSLDHKIEYYKAFSPDECGRLLTQPPFNGLAAVTYQDTIPWFRIAVSTTFYNPHEVMHIIALSYGIPSSIAFFSEGIAVAYGGTSFQTADYAHNYSKHKIDHTDYIPIKKLMTMKNSDFIRKNFITYQESGSFIRYLIDTYGIDKLRTFASGFNQNGDLNLQIMELYHKKSILHEGTLHATSLQPITLDDLEEQWKNYLRKIELPDIGFSLPATASLVFSMTDPKDDDQGDGDYEYPSNDNFLKGAFDLTKFEVFKDQDRAYFRIGLQKVIKPVSNSLGGIRFIPATVIAINKGDETKRQLYRYTNEIELTDGYDFKITVGFGITISNSFGKIFVSSDDIHHQMADLESNVLTFSIPIDLIGEPDENWAYFVGVGLTDEPTFPFSGLTPVLKNVPVLISGGNYDRSNPAFIDIMLPENLAQSDILSEYDIKKGKLAKVRMSSKY